MEAFSGEAMNTFLSIIPGEPEFDLSRGPRQDEEKFCPEAIRGKASSECGPLRVTIPWHWH
jgi:hypothetical protein